MKIKICITSTLIILRFSWEQAPVSRREAEYFRFGCYEKYDIWRHVFDVLPGSPKMHSREQRTIHESNKSTSSHTPTHTHTSGYGKPRIDCKLLKGLLVIIGRCILCAVLLMGRFQLFMRPFQTKLLILFASSVQV